MVRSQSPQSSGTVLLAVALIMVQLAALVALVAAAWYLLGWMLALLLLFVVLVSYVCVTKGYRFLYVIYRTLPRDLTAVYRYLKLVRKINYCTNNNLTVAKLFREQVAKTPNKICFFFEDQKWTYAQVDEYSNKIANVFSNHGFKHGDSVSLFMENRPEYVCIWLGLSKIGVVTALINFNLRNIPLTHSIKIANSQALIFGTELTDGVKEVLNDLDSSLHLYNCGGGSDHQSSISASKNLDHFLTTASPLPPPENDKLSFKDKLLYIYTSGTTGLPKAAVITNSRYFFAAMACHEMCSLKAEDIGYDPLPLYHMAGGVLGAGQSILCGMSMVLKKKFSVSQYWKDIIKHRCTAAQYIGEMCRYLLSVPPRPEDTEHKIRVIFGNGLRPQIWKQFVDRFKIPNVAEFYGATEGNANIVNVDNTVGAVGFLSRIAPSFYPITIIKVDETTGDPIRNDKGLCILCEPGEPGVFIGKIIPNNPVRDFHGYVDKKASEKKIVHDVYKKGDKAFISGDILVMDEFGYLFFKDRTGDTFRWRGENVATCEVEAVISNVVNLKDAVVFGVEIPNVEGRAGMAAILDVDDTLDFKSLAEGIRKNLATYARPVFIRVVKELDLTGTYKLKKLELQKEGFNPDSIKDKLYYATSSGQYEPLTSEIYDMIISGKMRF